jgi:hypothetical protein
VGQGQHCRRPACAAAVAKLPPLGSFQSSCALPSSRLPALQAAARGRQQVVSGSCTSFPGGAGLPHTEVCADDQHGGGAEVRGGGGRCSAPRPIADLQSLCSRHPPRLHTGRSHPNVHAPPTAFACPTAAGETSEEVHCRVRRGRRGQRVPRRSFPAQYIVEGQLSRALCRRTFPSAPSHLTLISP